MFFWRAFGAQMPGAFAFLALSALSAVVLQWWPRRAQPLAPGGAPARLGFIRTVIASIILVVSATCMLNAYGAITHSWRAGLWDAVAIYNVRGRLFYQRYDDFPSVLKEVSRSSHPNYPLLLPGSLAAQHSFNRGYTPAAPRLTALTFVLALGALLYASLRPHVTSASASVAVAVVWGTPLIWVIGFGQMADVPVAYFLLGAVVVVGSHCGESSERRLPAILGGFFLGCLIWTKNEGLVMAAIVLAVFALFNWRRWTRVRDVPVAAIGALAAGMLPALVALWIHKRDWAPGSGVEVFFSQDWLSRLTNWERWSRPLATVGTRLVKRDPTFEWAYLWPVLSVGVVLASLAGRWRRVRVAQFWAMCSVAVMLSWLPIYAITPYDQTWHINSSINRLMLQVYPVLLGALVLAFLARRPSAE
jgi:hypothetical protein